MNRLRTLRWKHMISFTSSPQYPFLSFRPLSLFVFNSCRSVALSPERSYQTDAKCCFLIFKIALMYKIALSLIRSKNKNIKTPYICILWEFCSDSCNNKMDFGVSLRKVFGRFPMLGAECDQYKVRWGWTSNDGRFREFNRKAMVLKYSTTHRYGH